MISRKELLESPNYLLTKYKAEIYRQLSDYMEVNNLTYTDIARKLQIGNIQVSQILNMDYDFSLERLIEFSLMIGKVPVIDFIDIEQYWNKIPQPPNPPMAEPLKEGKEKGQPSRNESRPPLPPPRPTPIKK